MRPKIAGVLAIGKTSQPSILLGTILVTTAAKNLSIAKLSSLIDGSFLGTYAGLQAPTKEALQSGDIYNTAQVLRSG